MQNYRMLLEDFAMLLQIQQQIQDKLDGVGCQANLDNDRTTIVLGKKYDKVNVGGSGKYMVDRLTGEIYGIKGYGQVHKGHRYGTLHGTMTFWWGDFHARRITSDYPAPKDWQAMMHTCDTQDEAPCTKDSACPSLIINAQEAL